MKALPDLVGELWSDLFLFVSVDAVFRTLLWCQTELWLTQRRRYHLSDKICFFFLVVFFPIILFPDSPLSKTVSMFFYHSSFYVKLLTQCTYFCITPLVFPKEEHFTQSKLFNSWNCMTHWWVSLSLRVAFWVCSTNCRKWHMRLMLHRQHDPWLDLQGSALAKSSKVH